MADEIREIHTAVVGNETMGHRGLVRRVDKLERIWLKVLLLGAMIQGGAIVAWYWIKHTFKLNV